MVAQRDPYDSPAIRAFAAELTAWRTDAGLSKLELAEKLGYTPQLIGQFEACKNIPSMKFAEDTDTFFKTNGVFVRLWNLINETRHLALLPSGFPDFIVREAEASRMCIFEFGVINGIFQTHDYAYEVLRPGRTEEEIEQLVAGRLDRQKILDSAKPPRIVAIYDEMAIRRMIGGPEVMREQIAHLIELAQRPNITIQIVPAGTGSYAGLPGAFAILGFDDAPDMVYTEGHVGDHLTTEGPTVREFTLVYDLIRGAAISADESLELLRTILESL
jgi:transcriptional regulator with XRE-family HTH domain